jgi:hypothetical protein
MFQKLSSALGTKYIASSDLRASGSNKMEKPQMNAEKSTLYLSTLPLQFLNLHKKYLKVATNTERNRQDFTIFLTSYLAVFTGL